VYDVIDKIYPMQLKVMQHNQFNSHKVSAVFW